MAMVIRSCDVESRAQRFDLRPNQSLTWPQARLAFLAVAGLSLTIAAGFAALGFWPILPFAGLEVGALGACLYFCARRGQRRELITVAEDLVEVQKGARRPQQGWRLPRPWTDVALQRRGAAWHPSRLLLRARGEGVEVGEFLTEEERQDLARDLRRLLAPLH
jgi:uncharacterized membrane protein